LIVSISLSTVNDLAENFRIGLNMNRIWKFNDRIICTYVLVLSWIFESLFDKSFNPVWVERVCGAFRDMKTKKKQNSIFCFKGFLSLKPTNRLLYILKQSKYFHSQQQKKK